MKEGYWFRSAAFQVEPGEDIDVNSGIYGRKLALWLSRQLELRGQAVIDGFPEDFGWCVSCQAKPFLLWIGCGNAAGLESREGTPMADHVVWHCFPIAEGRLFSRFFKKHDMELALSGLDDVLREILEAAPEIELVEAP